jgi:putative exporter of polyketide antibiotics
LLVGLGGQPRHRGCAEVPDTFAELLRRIRVGASLTQEALADRCRLSPETIAALRTTTLAYAASTAATGNPALVLAGLVTSVIFGWQRAATGGVLAPAVTHITWSVLMLRYLPPLFRDADLALLPD